MIILVFKDTNRIVPSDLIYLKKNKLLPYQDAVVNNYAQDIFYHTDIEPDYSKIIDGVILEFDRQNNLWKYLQNNNFLIQKKLSDLSAYDSSDSVNSFFISGLDIWLGKADRMSIANLANARKSAGQSTMELSLNNQFIELPIDSVLAMLTAIEIYAGDCYNVTQKHKQAIENLTTIEEIESYDFTQNYPTKLIF